MTTSWLVSGFSLYLCLLLNARAQENILSVVLREGTIRITYETSVGRLYELQQSSNMREWHAAAPTLAGDGRETTQAVDVETEGERFYRLCVTEAPSGLAPTEAEAIELFVGSTWQGYTFTSPTRFQWFSEGGEWSYEKTNPDSALLIFTYDEDGNNPFVYREEVILTFTTETSGNYRYSEFMRAGRVSCARR